MGDFGNQNPLSTGFFQALVSDTYPRDIKPTLQMIETKVLQASNMVRMRLSDGLFTYTGCMGSLEMAAKLESEGCLNSHAIIKVTEFVRSIISNKPCMTIINYQVLKLTNTKIGEPKPHSGNADDYRGIQNFPTAMQTGQSPAVQQNNSPSRKRGLVDQGSAIQSKRPNAPSGGVFSDGLLQVSMVTPYANAFRVCGAASMKENARTINTKRGPSSVFSFVLTDTEGNSIKITAFGKECEKFSDLIQDGEAYYVTCVGSSTVREANKRFNSTGHTYEITLNTQCNVELCTDREIGTPIVKLNTMSLIDIKNHVNECVDLLAVIDKVDEVGSVTVRSTQASLARRNVTLIDKSCTQVVMTLWGDEGVEKITPEQLGQVIGIKGASVREFNGGFSLSLGAGSLILTAPDGQATADLYNWYMEERPNAAVGSMTAADSGASFEQECRLIHILNDMDLNGLDRGMYASVHAFVNVIKGENIAYKACPNENCKKKVTEEGGQWRCNTCGLFDNHKFLYMLSVEIGDFTGLTWITLFDDTAAGLMGMSAEQLMQLKDSDAAAFEDVLAMNRYKSFEFRVRVQSETFNDKTRTRWSCMNIRPINTERYVKALQNTLAKCN